MWNFNSLCFGNFDDKSTLAGCVSISFSRWIYLVVNVAEFYHYTTKYLIYTYRISGTASRGSTFGI